MLVRMVLAKVKEACVIAVVFLSIPELVGARRGNRWHQ
jgi:hypothetical protein